MNACKLCEDRSIPYTHPQGGFALAIVRIRCDKHRVFRTKADAWLAHALHVARRLALPAPESRS